MAVNIPLSLKKRREKERERERKKGEEDREKTRLHEHQLGLSSEGKGCPGGVGVSSDNVGDICAGSSKEGSARVSTAGDIFDEGIRRNQR